VRAGGSRRGRRGRKGSKVREIRASHEGVQT
jgi:hypothetical protein